MFHKKLLLKISQYSQDNTSVGVSFNKVAGLQNYNFNKEQTPTQVYQRTAASSKAFIKKKCCIVNIQIYKYIQTYKCVLTEGQKVLFCQFKINIPTCWSASTNWILVRQRRMKSQEILYSKSNKKCVCLLYIYTYIHIYIHIHLYIHIHIHTHTYIQTYIHSHIYTDIYTYTSQMHVFTHI